MFATNSPPDLPSQDAEHWTSQKLKPGQKLRLSCDDCNKAKVKCTKDKPTCSRCETQNLRCVYGVSLRAGKRSVAPGLGRAQAQLQGLEDMANESPTRAKMAADAWSNSTAGRNPEYPTPQKYPVDDVLHSLYSGGCSGVPNYGGSDTYSTCLLQQQTLRPRDMELSSTETAEQACDQLQDWTTYDWLASSYQAPSFTASPAPQISDWHRTSNPISKPTPPSLSYSPTEMSRGTSIRSPTAGISTPRSYQTSPTSSSGYFSSNSPADVCRSLGFEPSIPNATTPYLHNFSPSICQCQASMISAQETLLRVSDPKTTSFDVALAANKDVSERCTTAIDCGCFTYDDSNAITLSSIIARMISVYRTSAAALGGSGSPDELFGGAKTSNGQNVVSRGAITMGAYTIDEEDEGRLKMEIVLIELEKMEKLVSELRKGFMKTGRFPSNSHNGDSSIQNSDCSFWPSLTDFLTQTLQAALLDLRSKVLEGDDKHWC